MQEQSYWINVPQGRGARLIRDVDWHQIQGLYSDGFTMCCLMAAIGKNRISLFHLDKQFSLLNFESDIQTRFRLRSVLQEMDWVKQDDPECRIVIVHKEGSIIEGMTIGVAKYNAECYQRFFKSHHIEVELQCVEDLQLGVSVNFKNGLQPYLREPRPHNLLCHPDEFKFNTAHQIEDAFYHLKIDESIRKQIIIFNGLFWQPITDQENSPQFKSKIPQSFLDLITPTMTTVEMLSIFSKKYNVSLPDKVQILTFPSETAFTIGPYISLYKNGHNMAKSFQLNLEKCILELEKQVKKIKGHSTKAVILAAVKNPTIAHQNIFKVVEDILEIDTSVMTKIHCKFLLSWASIYCTVESKYANVQRYPEWQQRAQKFMTTATKHLQEKQYQAAINIYQSCLPLLVYTSTEENDQLFSVTMNLAKCYFELQNYPSAARFLNIAVELTTKHHPQNSEQLLQLLKLIDQCDHALQNKDQIFTIDPI